MSSAPNGSPVELRFVATEEKGEVSALLLRPICARLGDRATRHVVDTAGHGFKVLKRSRQSDEPVLEELARVTAHSVSAVSGAPR